MGATAFSFSSSRMVWPLVMESPSFTRMLTTAPPSAFSPSFGNLTSIKTRETRSLRCQSTGFPRVEGLRRDRDSHKRGESRDRTRIVERKWGAQPQLGFVFELFFGDADEIQVPVGIGL